jgi:hypothetical protein
MSHDPIYLKLSDFSMLSTYNYDYDTPTSTLFNSKNVFHRCTSDLPANFRAFHAILVGSYRARYVLLCRAFHMHHLRPTLGLSGSSPLLFGHQAVLLHQPRTGHGGGV